MLNTHTHTKRHAPSLPVSTIASAAGPAAAPVVPAVLAGRGPAQPLAARGGRPVVRRGGGMMRLMMLSV